MSLVFLFCDLSCRAGPSSWTCGCYAVFWDRREGHGVSFKGDCPSFYGARSNDAIMPIASALAKVGNIPGKDALRAALNAAEFAPVRGTFKFRTNTFRVKNVYLREAVVDADGGCLPPRGPGACAGASPVRR